MANKMPAGMHQDCHNLINRLLGKIKQWDKPMEWCPLAGFVRNSNWSPFLVVIESGRLEIRLPFYQRQQSEHLMMDKGAEKFMCFNLTNAYFQIKVAEGSQHLHACMTPLGKAHTTLLTTSISKIEICLQRS